MHNIEYRSYEENIHRDYVQRELDHYVSGETRGEGGHGLGQNIRWLDSVSVCSDRDSAERVITDNDRGWYDQLAVRYYEVKPVASEKLNDLRAKTNAAMELYYARSRAKWVDTVKADFVGCKACGSKLARVYIKTNRCPVCANDLRPETLRKSVETAKAKWERTQAAEREYIKKHGEKTIKWLVKIEYHT